MGLDLMAHPPPLARVRALLRRYVRVRLEAEKDHLASGDRLAITKLIDAARWIDRIYWRQRSDIGWELLEALRRSREHAGSELDRLVTVNVGPWDNLNGDSPFWGDAEVPPGGNFYPPDLSREELNAYLARHPEESAALLRPTTLIRRRGDRLVAIPYEEAYAKELEQTAAALRAASATVTHDGFRRYLTRRADGLRTGALFESEKLWVRESNGPIDIAIGPYEVYDDGLKGVKTSYEAVVLVRHALTERLAQFEHAASELGRELPGAVADTPVDKRVRIGVFDVEYVSGMLNMGSKAIAVTLPNDERVRAEAGTRLLLFRNVIEAKFDCILKPLAARIMPADELALVHRDAFLFQTLLHEAGHALSADVVRSNGRGRTVTIKEALGERYSTIEECRADLLGLYFLELLVRHGVLPRDLAATAAPTFVAHSVRAIRFGVRSDHARAAAITLSHLFRMDAVRREGDGLRVDPGRTARGVQELAAHVQSIANHGDYAAAGRLIEEHGSTPAPIAELLRGTEDVPVDLEFAFGESGGGLG
jgi:hypothetical protein